MAGAARFNLWRAESTGAGPRAIETRQGKQMRALTHSLVRDEPVAAAAIIVALGGMATILGAWFFEYALGYAPCPLCLQQRIPYYVAIPLAVLIAAGALARWPRLLLLSGLVL